MHRRKILTLTVMLLALVQVVPAQASTGWRYWGYFQAAPGVEKWSYALTGPTSNIADGSVEGWVFTFSGDEVEDAAVPKVAPRFSRICSSIKPVAQKKRIGLVVDFGPAAIRPVGEKLPRALITCVVVDKNATGVDVLNAAVKVRYASSGFVCGINNYPAKECGQQIKTPRTLVKK